MNIAKIKELPDVESIQKYVTVTGIMRNEHNFAGIIFKGIGKDFDSLRFKKFLIAGTTPKVTEVGFNNDVAISQKIANDLHLKVNDSIVTVFLKADQNLFTVNSKSLGFTELISNLLMSSL